jgi:hypothetical protein
LFYKYNISKSSWSKLSSLNHDFKQVPILLDFNQEYIYVFDNLKNFFYYDISGDCWTTCKPTYKDAFNLNQRNILPFMDNNNVLIIGGHSDTERVCDLYFLKDSECIVSKKSEFILNSGKSKLGNGYCVVGSFDYIIECDEENEKIIVHRMKGDNKFKWDMLPLGVNTNI